MSDTATADDIKPKSGIKWGGVLKWTFRFAVIGLGGMVGSELIMGGFIHSDIDIAQAFLHSAIEFMEPLVEGLQNWMTGGGAITVDQAMEPINGAFKGIHEFFGITDTFNPTVLADIASAEPANSLSAATSSIDTTGVDFDSAFSPD